MGVEPMPDLHTKGAHLGNGQLGQSMAQDIASIQDIDLVIARRLHQVNTGRFGTQTLLHIVAVVAAELHPVVETVLGYVVKAVVRLQARHNILPALAALRDPGPVQPVSGLRVVASQTGGRRGRDVGPIRFRDIELEVDFVQVPLAGPLLRGGHEVDDLVRLVPAHDLGDLEPAHGEGHWSTVQRGYEDHMPVVPMLAVPDGQALQQVAPIADLVRCLSLRKVDLPLHRRHFVGILEALLLLGHLLLQLVAGGEDGSFGGQDPAVVDGHLGVDGLAKEVRRPAQDRGGLGLLPVGHRHREIAGRGPGEAAHVAAVGQLGGQLDLRGKDVLDHRKVDHVHGHVGVAGACLRVALAHHRRVLDVVAHPGVSKWMQIIANKSYILNISIYGKL